MQVATHPGNFHADDVFAVAVLGLVHGPVQVVRTRDEAAQAAADVRVDVGGRADAATGDFDHHQKGGAGERPNGIRYASFGLVWRDARRARWPAARRPRRRSTSASSRASTPTTPASDHAALVEGVRPMSVSGVIAALNPAWDEELTPAQEDERFTEAVPSRPGSSSASWPAPRRSRAPSSSCATRSAGPPTRASSSCDRNMPWREPVVSGAPQALYVMYPKSDGWGMQAVPRALGGFANRKDLPEAWAGRSRRRPGRGHRRARCAVLPPGALLRLGRLARGDHRAGRPGVAA